MSRNGSFEPGAEDLMELEVLDVGASFGFNASLRATGAAFAVMGVFTPLTAEPFRRCFISVVLSFSANVFFTGLGTPPVTDWLTSC